ncbi:fungal-specific transcription factor domain-containing protein [Mycena sanguinolenta]|nr:fungal-specific transcription factor domain-containing protein [Mycena sanguinolenta]
MFASHSDAASQAIPRESRASVHGRERGVWFEESPANGQGDDEGEEDTGKDVNADVLPIASALLGLIAHLSLDESDLGVANTAYFEPGPATDLNIRARLLEHSAPEIIIHGIVVPEDVDKLFEIFHAKINPFISLLDPVLHTPTSTFTRCPVLFTVVCAVSSQYYTEKSEIYPIVMHFAKRSAANALNEGWKTIELCQAYLLLSIYAVPARNWEADCSWLYIGVAIRLATDLNLDKEPINRAAEGNEKWERELLNRTRVWMICFIWDHLIATQSGKPPAIKPDVAMKRRSDDWYRLSPYNSVYDLHLCLTVGLLLIVADFHDQISSDVATPSGLNQVGPSTGVADHPPQHVDFSSVTVMYDAKLGAFSDEWAYRLAQQSNSIDHAFTLQFELLTLLTAYSRLIMFSFALEQRCRTRLQSTDDILFTKCLESAKTVLHTAVTGLGPAGLMRYSPDGHFIIVTFASAMLLKLLGPEFSYLTLQNKIQVYGLIRQVIQTLSSSAVDYHHIPKLYAHFLDGLLSRQHRDSPTLGYFHHEQAIPQSIGGTSSRNYWDQSHTSSIFTISSFSGGGAAADSEQGTDEYYGAYQQAEIALIPIHRPVARHSIQMELATGLYNQPA